MKLGPEVKCDKQEGLVSSHKKYSGFQNLKNVSEIDHKHCLVHFSVVTL